MKNLFISFSLFIIAISLKSQSLTPPPEVQIKVAVLAAPADKRAGAMVYGYNQSKEITVLKKGTNEMICIGDDPTSKGINVSCYHKDLEPFMARGRELKKQGKGFQEIFDIREKDAKTGKLFMPKQPSTLFVFSASEEKLDPSTGDVKDGNLRYVIYIPYATSENTGLPLSPEAPGMPWIMYPGTHGAHIMINPPVKE